MAERVDDDAVAAVLVVGGGTLEPRPGVDGAAHGAVHIAHPQVQRLARPATSTESRSSARRAPRGRRP
ncbi:MAG: hypothetical protein M3R63_11285 [Actinomycetota bacterium]|nr:hypothetical protein [Actinomycetota bacterium]